MDDLNTKAAHLIEWARRGELEDVADTIERLQRDYSAAIAVQAELRAALNDAHARAEKAERERDEARAELAALKSAGVALRDDMLMRARIRAEFEGREVPTVDASDGIWMSFCAALSGEG